MCVTLPVNQWQKINTPVFYGSDREYGTLLPQLKPNEDDVRKLRYGGCHCMYANSIAVARLAQSECYFLNIFINGKNENNRRMRKDLLHGKM